MAKAWPILVAAHLMMPLAEPACPEGDACPVLEDDTYDEMSMLQNRRLLVKNSSMSSGVLKSSESSTEASDCESDLDVPYGDNDKHKVDVYWPADVEKPSDGWTAVIILPGKGATRKNWKGFCTKYMVPEGRLCVAADYRQGNDYRKDDVYKFATWFYSNADRWDVDSTKIVLGGASQGGLTINNVIWDNKMAKDLLKGDPPKLRAVMLCSGVWDSHQRKAKNAKYLPKSTLIITSDDDKTVPTKYSTNLYKELDRLEQDVKYVEIPGGGHSVWDNKPNEWYPEIIAFLDEIVPVGNTYS